MRRAVAAVAVVVVALVLWRLLGTTTLSDGATDMVVRAAGSVGIVDAEGVQDAYLGALGLISLAIAIAVVFVATRVIERRRRR